MIRKHTRRAAKAAFAISLGVAIVIGLFAAVFARPVHASSTTSPTVIIGTKNFPEEFILGELYKQALQAKGFQVSYKENIGSTELIQTSLTSGKINFYPEYTGVIVQDVFHHTNSPKTGSATYLLAKKLEAAKAMERPNTIWIILRNPPAVSPKAQVRPVTMMTMTATILATGPCTESKICWSGCSQGILVPAA